MNDSVWPMQPLKSNQAHGIPEEHRQEWQMESFKWPNMYRVAPRTRICLNYEDSSPNERISRVHREASRILNSACPPWVQQVYWWRSCQSLDVTRHRSCDVWPHEFMSLEMDSASHLPAALVPGTAQRPFWSKLCCQNWKEYYACLRLLNNFNYSWLFFRLYAAFFESDNW